MKKPTHLGPCDTAQEAVEQAEWIFANTQIPMWTVAVQGRNYVFFREAAGLNISDYVPPTTGTLSFVEERRFMEGVESNAVWIVNEFDDMAFRRMNESRFPPPHPDAPSDDDVSGFFFNPTRTTNAWMVRFWKLIDAICENEEKGNRPQLLLPPHIESTE